MSSHREAPEIAKDPVADSSDLYAFVSPDAPDTVTLIANYVPLQGPAGGPNFFEFGTDVMYEIHISNKGTAKADITYQFAFTTTIQNTSTFLYNTGQVTSLTDPHFNRRQTYTVTRVAGGKSKVLAKGLACPPCNVGPRSMPDYDSLADAAVHTLAGGRKVFAGQRADGFWVDLGAVFDLLDLRPFENLHLIPTAATDGVDTLAALNVHSIALQVPISDLTVDGTVPTDVASSKSVIGVWTTASRKKSRVWDPKYLKFVGHGSWQQVSRLGNPLVNEVLIPLAGKDHWNARTPDTDKSYLSWVQKPEVATLLPALYPDVFPKLAAYTKARADLVAVLLTGLPSGVVTGFQNYTGKTVADMLRLNVAVPPAAAGSENPIGLVGGDAAGYPNGRRVGDNVVAIELRAIAGATLPLVDSSFTPDSAAGALTDGSTPPDFLSAFPYLGVPYDGFTHPAPAS
jgi:hypothetical protein